MLPIPLLVLLLYLPQIEPVQRPRNPWAILRHPTRPLNCEPHQVNPLISFKKTFLDHPFTLGTSDFVKLLQNNEIFFDNSLFIKSVLETPNSNPTMLILGPARWGKTTNLQMLKSFLQIPVNDAGRRITPVENSSIYKLFKYGEIQRDDGSVDLLRTPLRISRYKYLFPMFFGRCPVIYVSFKHVSGTTYEQIKDKMQKAISRAFWEHKYMLQVLVEGQKHKNIPNAERKMTWFKANLYSNSPYEKNLTGSLAFLCQILRNHFRKTVFVLIDDYDAPLYSALQSAELSRYDIGQVLHLFANLLGWTFRGRPFLKRGIVVGNSQLGQYERSSWREYDVHSFAQNSYPMMQYFGLTSDNFRLILEYYNISEELTRQAFQWYGGYTSSIRGQSFCHPASVIQFLNSRQITSYLLESSSLEVINKLLRTSRLYREDVFALLSQKHVQTGERLILNERTLTGLQDIFTKTPCASGMSACEINYNATMLFHAHLMDQGVLTVVRSSGSAILAKIPNKEVAFEFTKRMIQYIREQYHIRQEPLKNAAYELLEFIQSPQMTHSPNLEYWLRMIYARSSQLIRHVKNITSLNYSNEFERPECLIFTCVVLEMQCLSKLRFQIHYDRHLGADIVVRDIETSISIVIQIRENHTVDSALEKAQSYGYLLNNTDTTIIKYIGVNVLPSGEAQVRSKTRREGYTYVEPKKTYSLTYPVFKITTKRSKSRNARYKASPGIVFEYPNGSPNMIENPFFNN